MCCCNVAITLVYADISEGRVYIQTAIEDEDGNVLSPLSHVIASMSREESIAPKAYPNSGSSDSSHSPMSSYYSSSDAGSIPIFDDNDDNDKNAEIDSPIRSPCDDMVQANAVMSPKPGLSIKKTINDKPYVIIRSASAGKVAVRGRSSRVNCSKGERCRSLGPAGSRRNAPLSTYCLVAKSPKPVDISEAVKYSQPADEVTFHALNAYSNKIGSSPEAVRTHRIGKRNVSISKFAARVMKRWGGGHKENSKK